MNGVAVRSLKNLCAFVGAIALLSYFGNWAVDLRHWYVTVVSALMCGLLWLGFYLIELEGGVRHVAARVSRVWAEMRIRAAELPTDEEAPGLQADPLVAGSAAEPAATGLQRIDQPSKGEDGAPATEQKPRHTNGLAWLRARPPEAIGGNGSELVRKDAAGSSRGWVPAKSDPPLQKAKSQG